MWKRLVIISWGASLSRRIVMHLFPLNLSSRPGILHYRPTRPIPPHIVRCVVRPPGRNVLKRDTRGTRNTRMHKQGVCLQLSLRRRRRRESQALEEALEAGLDVPPNIPRSREARARVLRASKAAPYRLRKDCISSNASLQKEPNILFSWPSPAPQESTEESPYPALL